MPKLKLDIVTAERALYSDEVDVVIAPGSEGVMAILPRHAPLLTALQPGELVAKKDGEEIVMTMMGGFMEVQPERVVILADVAERAEEIDLERAEAARQRAEQRLREAGPTVDRARAVAALHRAQVRLRVARRRGRGT